MATKKQKIVNRLMSLADSKGIKVDVSEEQSSMTISHYSHHSADFKLRWVDGDHYAGYFVDGNNGECSQAIVSIWTPMDAIKFAAMYMMMVELRARR